jgi:hypothetical protein
MTSSPRFRGIIVFAIGFLFAAALGVCARWLWLWPRLRSGGIAGVLLYWAFVFGIGMMTGWAMRLVAPRLRNWYYSGR